MPGVLDLRAATVRGAVTHPKARVVWQDGRLKAYTLRGQVFDLAASRPVPRSRWCRQWNVMTEKGAATLAERCWTCGGWWRLAMMPLSKLQTLHPGAKQEKQETPHEEQR